MKYRWICLLIATMCLSCKDNAVKKSVSSNVVEKTEPLEWAIVLHGGAGSIQKGNLSPQKEKAIRTKLQEALYQGTSILKAGGSSLDAVEQTITILEDSEYFNAGKGAVFTAKEENELDASIMSGNDQNAGAVGGVKTIKNPIKLARAVMEKSNHVLLTGIGAEEFAKEVRIEQVNPSYFKTQKNLDVLHAVQKREQRTGYHTTALSDAKMGTVGCAALDKNGNLAAGTSTGGMTNKKYNRIGDSPIIGAGTYADNTTCAISSTGHGEYFIRYVVAYDIAARMKYGNQNFQEAAQEVIENTLKAKGGAGGIIGVDKYGNIAMPFNTAGMYRAYATPQQEFIGIYKSDSNE